MAGGINQPDSTTLAADNVTMFAETGDIHLGGSFDSTSMPN